MDHKRKLIGGAGFLAATILCCGFVSQSFFGSAVPMVSSGGTILEWLFSEGTGSVIHDTSGNGNNGSTSGTWQTVVGVPCLSFLGDGDYALSSNSVNYSGANILTLDFSIYADDWTMGTSENILLSSPATGGAAGGWWLGQSTSGYIICTIRDAGTNYQQWSSASVPSTGTWHHMQIVLNETNGSVAMYIDSGGNQGNNEGGAWHLPTTFSTQTFWVSNGGSAIFSIRDLYVNVGDTHTL